MRTSEQSLKTESPPGGNSQKRKKIKLPENSKITKKIIRELEIFLDFVPPERLNRNLRNIFLSYLYYEKDFLPDDFDETITDFQFMFQFLDSIERKA
jgi:hypothetical protein